MAQSPDADGETRLGPVKALRAVFSGVGQLLLAADRFREEEASQLQAEATSQPVAPEDEQAPPRLLKITGNTEPPRVSAKTPKESAGGAKPAKSSPAPKSAKVAANSAKRPSKKAGGKAAPQQSRFRSLDSTGNVRILTDQDKADLAEDEFERGQLIRPTIRLTEAASPSGYFPSAYEPTSFQTPSFATPSYDLPSHEFPSYQTPSYQTPSYETPSSYETTTELDGGYSTAGGLPIAGYDGLSIASLRARLRGLDPDDLRVLADYEAAHANRVDVVTMFENRIIKLQSGD